ncbi:DUF2652 domain-containing protein [Hymenobacter sp. DG25A]|uniref:DUF2652 domain-containing protein n=1 Tax=Hymenobacter sp. DG25A TaxID=1385663 RepID=UPI0006C88FF3|nr:DUF2652 domain-containing protein [Hymenobacter sp. DG25A]
MGLLDDIRAARRTVGSRVAVPEPQPALLFIPDISGFTQFIENSGSPLAPWLIADLLEVLIEGNMLDMQVSEIQGDAILFYRLGRPPAIAEVVAQCRRMFLDFQNYLRLVERDAGSALGAALLANELTLKIIVHYGQVHVAQIRQYTKLMGRDVIVVHRLLKNDIMGGEYALLSDGYLNTQPPAAIRGSFSWTRLLHGLTTYDVLGAISYRYAHLTPLRLLVDRHGQARPAGTQANAVVVRRVLPVPAGYALRIVSNLRLRCRWLQGAHSVEYDRTKANRLGTNYRIGLNRGEINVQAVQRFEQGERLEYVEKISHFRIFPNSLLFFFLEEVSDQACLLTLEFRYGHIAGASALIRFGQLRRLQRFLGASIRQLEVICNQMRERQRAKETPPEK